MCAALPARVVEILETGRALVEQNGAVRQVSVQLLPDVLEGEYVLLNLGVAVQKLSADEAQEVLDLWQEINSTFQ